MKPNGDPSENPDAQYDIGISTVSDNYITEALEQFAESHEQYILQWSEQQIVLDDVQTDHHGKRFVSRVILHTCVALVRTHALALVLRLPSPLPLPLPFPHPYPCSYRCA